MSKSRIPRKIKTVVVIRAGFRCEYCKAPKAFAPSPFNVDHIVPEAGGGSSDPENLAFACENCNGNKSDKTHGFDAETGERVPLFHPRKDSWTDHFQWTENQQFITGLTATGRATVETLQLNHPAVVNMRLLLKMVGEHPPKDTV
jgi:hypothetical protein